MSKRRLAFLALVAASGLAWPRGAASADPPLALVLVPVASGLASPVGVVDPGDGSGRLFIVLQAGQIRVVDGGALLPTPFLDLTAQVSTLGNERGLLGLVFHPDYASNGLFFVDYTDLGGDTVVARYQVSSDPNVAEPASATTVLTVDQPGSNHNGGQLEFGPDGALYVALGDGGGTGDPADRAQRLDDLLGKILRIDVDSATPYAIPPDNPFVGTAGASPEIWVYGLRNPWRFSFDRETGDLWIADVGQSEREEIDVQPAGSPGGENYGWDVEEGSTCYDPDPDLGEPPCGDPTLVRPILEYDHTLGCSVTGGYRYRGSSAPHLVAWYLYADFCSGRIWGATESEGAWTAHELLDTTLSIASFGEDAAGELYLVDRDPANGIVYQITSPPPCGDGLDNDGDGAVDAPSDPGCQDAEGQREDPQCQDGVNNDPAQDALIDFDGGISAGLPPEEITQPDPQCQGIAWRNRERARSCGLGFELASVLIVLLAWRPRRSGTERRA